LKSYGVGPLTPRKPNTTDANRAVNRRVELVPF
jgi:outer membrane protein OmpA-like peptidoglycan-associated protein